MARHRRVSLSEKFASYYGNLRGLLLGSNLSGRRATPQENLFPEEAQLTSFKKDKESKEEGQLKPKSVDLNRYLNRLAHRTKEYEIPNLLLRRGQAFDLSIIFDRTFSRQDDTIVLKFVTGSQPRQSKGTVVPVKMDTNLNNSQWGYQLLSAEDRKVNLKVMTAHDAIVGRYHLFVETTHVTEDGTIEKYRYRHNDDVYILFNPWCQEDPVFLEEETQRQEYVLKETGRIWLGTVGKFCVRPWNFGQFDDICLIAALAILEKSELGDQARGNPIYVVRQMSKVINNNERDGGVLLGNWSGKYDDGVAPYAWNGSSAILEEFYKKRKGVKYGQCWTFAAVATTVFRSLGIPTRCVTSFKAAHDSDYSSPMDAYWTLDGKPRKSSDDAIWDFHVWNESWFRRPDLPPGYDGWQAFDVTPQECLEGVFTCGPCSVKGIRQGELYYGFDAKFLFAEVNGDRVHWIVDSDGNMTPVAKETGIMGRCISTKAVSTISREDLTNAYKFSEGSKEENDTIAKAEQFCSRHSLDIEPTKEDITFTFSGDATRVGDFTAILDMENTSDIQRVVNVYMCATSCRYTGIPVNEIKDTSTTSILEPYTKDMVTITAKCADFINSIDAESHVNIYVMATVKETGQRFVKHEALWVEKPHLELKTEGSAHVGKLFDVAIKLVNPLSVPLTGGYINMEGPGMQRVATVKVKKSIAPGEEIRETIQLKPRRLGRKEIIASFQCKQVCDVTGVTEVDVVEDTKG
ncbi:hypothetical protein CHS0354_027163 [Potamilus streckersoni]|uniref:Transglutaminase-like domain-containing protein n=1 Tax=Potamilus streckersoni TaxID=2493646 RepID=A0AAE0TJA9_9BIVA|nr:hypothetical protein CHS0354_027163 [Potamilus streckersoni]